MQIENISIQPYCLPFKSPFVTATDSFSDRLGFKVLVKSNWGDIGYGEAAPLPGWGMETLAQTAEALAEMSEKLLGKNIQTTDQIIDLLVEYSETPAAKHGMELAIVDLLAQSQNLSVAKLLNSNSVTKVEVNGLVGVESKSKTIIQARALINQGYKCLKLKLGKADWNQNLETIKAVRKELGTELKIRLDPNQAWNLDQAIAYLPQLVPVGIEYIEQPLPKQNLGDMAKLCQLKLIAIAADESVQNLAQLNQVIKAQAADLVILKPMALGGILTTFKAAQIAINAGLEVVITTTLDGAIARLGALHLAAALPKSNYAHRYANGLATGHLLAEDLCDHETLNLLSQNPIKLLAGNGLGLGLTDQI